MQEKTIKSVLRKKIDDWLKSISSESLRLLVYRDAIVTGGAITSLLSGTQPNDFDIYFKTRETTTQVAEYYLTQFKNNPPSKFKNGNQLVDIKIVTTEDRVKIVVKSQGIASESGTNEYQYFEQVSDPSEPTQFVEAATEALERKEDKEKDESSKPKYRPVFLSANAITLSCGIQIVIRFFGPVDKIHENFDFVHCTCYWESETNELVLPNAALVSLINKRLKYKSSKYPLCSIIRTRKFLAQGWHIDAGQYVKMAWDLNKLDLKDINTLEDQMIGVDSAYFEQVIQLLKEGMKDGVQVEDTYLIQVIDKVFG